MTADLSVPSVGEEDALTAALAYAEAGWYVLPVKRGTKNPGSVLGGGWHTRSSRDLEQLVAWFAGADHGIALHVGRSGAVAFDVDDPQALADVPVLVRALHGTPGPVQTTREGLTGRGHFLYQSPPGRVLGNGKGRLDGSWGEVRGRNGVIIVAPSVHESPEGRYRWVRMGPVPVLPPELAAALDDAAPSVDAATDGEVAAFLAAHTTVTKPRTLTMKLTGLRAKLEAGESRHAATVPFVVGAMKEARAGYYRADEAADQLREVFVAAMATARPGDAGARTLPPAAASAEFDGILAWAVAQAGAADLAETHARIRQLAGPPLPAFVPTMVTAPAATDCAVGRFQQLVSFVEQLRGWLDLPDPGHVLLTLAAAVTRDLPGEPVWLLLVAPPSSGKTESVGLLDDLADGRLNDVTVAGLLGWSKGGGKAKPTGLLARVGARALLTFGDLSSLLATSNGGGRDAVFGLLRRAYDGHVTRDISADGRAATNEPLSWEGRLTVVAAVTGAIDNYSAHNDQLGPRWVYVRLPDRDTRAKRRAAALVRRGGLTERRAAARRAATQLVSDAARLAPAVVVPPAVEEAVEDAALVACWGRAAVPRHGYGARPIDGLPTIEEPMRLIRQLLGLARGLLALGLPEGSVTALLRRVALDSMPATRRAVLATLSLGEPLSTTALARAAGLDRKVARFQAEELQAIGVVHGQRDGDPEDEDENDRRRVTWQLAAEDGSLIADVFAAQRRAPRWDEMGGPTPLPPGKGDEDGEVTDTSSHLAGLVRTPFAPLSGHREVSAAPSQSSVLAASQ